MKIALLGYGKMGKATEEAAMERGHSIVAKIDKDATQGSLDLADVAVNFSIPSTAVDNIKSALDLHIPVVCGTTGWLENLEEIKQYCIAKNSAFLYASNFSIGVNLFFKLNETLARLMKPHKAYKPKMKEIHHINKLDAPSGTAISLANGIFNETDYYDNWSLDKNEKDKLYIDVEREKDVAGTHSVNYSSAIDSIKIEHEAHSRKGFALGAVIAAEWIHNKQGIYSMDDVLNLG